MISNHDPLKDNLNLLDNLTNTFRSMENIRMTSFLESDPKATPANPKPTPKFVNVPTDKGVNAYQNSAEQAAYKSWGISGAEFLGGVWREREYELNKISGLFKEAVKQIKEDAGKPTTSEEDFKNLHNRLVVLKAALEKAAPSLAALPEQFKDSLKQTWSLAAWTTRPSRVENLTAFINTFIQTTNTLANDALFIVQNRLRGLEDERRVNELNNQIRQYEQMLKAQEEQRKKALEDQELKAQAERNQKSQEEQNPSTTASNPPAANSMTADSISIPAVVQEGQGLAKVQSNPQQGSMPPTAVPVPAPIARKRPNLTNYRHLYFRGHAAFGNSPAPSSPRNETVESKDFFRKLKNGDLENTADSTFLRYTQARAEIEEAERALIRQLQTMPINNSPRMVEAPPLDAAASKLPPPPPPGSGPKLPPPPPPGKKPAAKGGDKSLEQLEKLQKEKEDKEISDNAARVIEVTRARSRLDAAKRGVEDAAAELVQLLFPDLSGNETLMFHHEDIVMAFSGFMNDLRDVKKFAIESQQNAKASKLCAEDKKTDKAKLKAITQIANARRRLEEMVKARNTHLKTCADNNQNVRTIRAKIEQLAGTLNHLFTRFEKLDEKEQETLAVLGQEIDGLNKEYEKAQNSASTDNPKLLKAVEDLMKRDIPLQIVELKRLIKNDSIKQPEDLLKAAEAYMKEIAKGNIVIEPEAEESHDADPRLTQSVMLGRNNPSSVDLSASVLGLAEQLRRRRQAIDGEADEQRPASEWDDVCPYAAPNTPRPS